MASTPAPSAPPDKENYSVNFFRPRAGFMRREVRFIWIMLVGWALFTFGFQFLLVLLQRTSEGAGPVTEATIFGFPLHYWFTGHFLIVWFILLSLFFNLFIDRLTESYRKRRQEPPR
jgi:putative solute:sodium symporter small subunit